MTVFLHVSWHIIHLFFFKLISFGNLVLTITDQHYLLKWAVRKSTLLEILSSIPRNFPGRSTTAIFFINWRILVFFYFVTECGICVNWRKRRKNKSYWPSIRIICLGVASWKRWLLRYTCIIAKYFEVNMLLSDGHGLFNFLKVNFEVNSRKI